MHSRTALLLTAASVFLPTTAAAQFVVYDIRGDSGADLLGTSIAKIRAGLRIERATWGRSTLMGTFSRFG